VIVLDVTSLAARAGEEVAVSDWMTMTQDRVAQFAEAIDDRQWIHLDAARAAKESPYGATVAHGFLTLSLLSMLLREAVRFDGVGMALNYGLNRVRFPSPVVVGTRVRGRFAVAATEPVPGGVQVTWKATVECEGSEKPACVAEWVVRYYVPN
jgi:acyl dehydratase